MKHKLFSIAGALSLLLCLATAVLWIATRTGHAPLRWRLNDMSVGTTCYGWGASYDSLVLDSFRPQRHPIEGPAVTLHSLRKTSGEGWVVHDMTIGPNPQLPTWERQWPTHEVRLLGFSYVSQPCFIDSKATPPVRSFIGFQLRVTTPFWSILIATLVLPAVYGWYWNRLRRRKTRGLCISCGYNLTGNTSGVCPECGTPAPGKSEATA